MLSASAWFSCVVALAFLFRWKVPEAYMDEWFHVRQTLRYWNGEWHSWDEKITTPPGLYVLGWSICWFKTWLWKGTDGSGCNVTVLRATNLLGSMVCYSLFSSVIEARSKEEEGGSRRVPTLASVLCFYPFHFFYCFLYYTDVWSTAFVLLSYQACLSKRHLLSAVFGACSIMMRQTNAVWFCFVTAVGMRRHLLRESMGKRTRSKRNDIHSSFEELRWLAIETCRRKKELFVRFFFPLTVIFMFVAFVFLNQGVALGDRSAHALSFHPTQLLYFSLVYSFMRLPRFVEAIGSSNRTWLDCMHRRKASDVAWVLGVASALYCIIDRYTIYHPYILADNRHFTFYLRRWVLEGTRFGPFLLMPCYMYSLHFLWQEILHAEQPMLESMAWFVCTFLSLVFSPLVELRYFNLPFFFLALHSSTNKPSTRWMELLLYVLIDGMSAYVFLYHPFTWADGSIARFMW